MNWIKNIFRKPEDLTEDDIQEFYDAVEAKKKMPFGFNDRQIVHAEEEILYEKTPDHVEKPDLGKN